MRGTVLVETTYRRFQAFLSVRLLTARVLAGRMVVFTHSIAKRPLED